MKRFFLLVVPVVGVLGALYFYVVLNWDYSTGERAGWVQKFSRKGWICKTWEGELAMVSMPGTTQEKFYFTVWDEDVAKRINQAMGRRVSLHYDEKVGLPTTCFGDTRYWVSNVTVVTDIPLAPGIVVPTAPPGTPAPAPAAPGGAAPSVSPAAPAAPAAPPAGTPAQTPQTK